MNKLLALGLSLTVYSSVLMAAESLPEIGSHLYQSRVDLPNDTVYEIVTSNDGLGWSLAVIDIGKGGDAHYHLHTAETYTVLSGTIEVLVDGQAIILRAGETFKVPLNTVHSAHSTSDAPARVLVSCIPGWTPEDHHVVE